MYHLDFDMDSIQKGLVKTTNYMAWIMGRQMFAPFGKGPTKRWKLSMK